MHKLKTFATVDWISDMNNLINRLVCWGLTALSAQISCHKEN